ncbi:MAG: hypothetical protein HC923_08470, partial [Myxococcales bacterium]|nr:hypothetical protein [Myxococcales bacterium]
ARSLPPHDSRAGTFSLWDVPTGNLIATETVEGRHEYVEAINGNRCSELDEPTEAVAVEAAIASALRTELARVWLELGPRGRIHAVMPRDEDVVLDIEGMDPAQLNVGEVLEIYARRSEVEGASEILVRTGTAAIASVSGGRVRATFPRSPRAPVIRPGDLALQLGGFEVPPPSIVRLGSR